MWALIEFSLSSIFWGILIAAVCIAIFVFLIKGWWKNAMFTIPTYIVGVILFVLLSIQCILICGAIKIIDLSDFVQVEVERIIDLNYMPDCTLSVGEADNVIQELIGKFPILGNYIGSGYFEGHTTESMPLAAKEALEDFMTSYITRRLLWCLGFTVIAAIIAIKTINKGCNSRSTRGSYGRSRSPIEHRRMERTHTRVRRTR